MTPPPKRQDDWAEKQAQALMVDFPSVINGELCNVAGGTAVIAQALRQARLSALEEAAKVAGKAMYWDALEFSAWMGLPERKRSDWAKRLGEGVRDAIRALADGGGKA